MDRNRIPFPALVAIIIVFPILAYAWGVKW